MTADEMLAVIDVETRIERLEAAARSARQFGGSGDDYEQEADLLRWRLAHPGEPF